MSINNRNPNSQKTKKFLLKQKPVAAVGRRRTIRGINETESRGSFGTRVLMPGSVVPISLAIYHIITWGVFTIHETVLNRRTSQVSNFAIMDKTFSEATLHYHTVSASNTFIRLYILIRFKLQSSQYNYKYQSKEQTPGYI